MIMEKQNNLGKVFLIPGPKPESEFNSYLVLRDNQLILKYGNVNNLRFNDNVVYLYIGLEERFTYGDCIIEESNDFTLPAVLTKEHADISLYFEPNQWNLTAMKMIGSNDSRFIRQHVSPLPSDFVKKYVEFHNAGGTITEIALDKLPFPDGSIDYSISVEFKKQEEPKSEFDKIFEEYDDVYQPLNRGDFSVGFNAAVSHYDSKLYNALHKLVQLKDLKDNFGKTETYEREQPKAWDEARQILNELNIDEDEQP